MHVELKKGVYWVGVVDWQLRLFHGHELSTHRGSSYNSYLIVDDKIALVDTVWSPFSKQLMENIRELVDPAKIDYVIANHSEVDHSGALPEVLAQCPNATLVVSKNGAGSVEGHYHRGWKYRIVKTGERISLGKNELVFIEAPMLHWPDSMFTYLTGLNILMPNDAFGQHYATAFRFNDEVDNAELYDEAQKYYANILTPYSDFVLKKIDEFVKLNVPVDIIAPSHGVIWRKDPLQIVTQYAAWAKQEPKPTAVIVYDTMWNCTRRMADAIGEGLGETGVDYKIFNVSTADRNDIISELLLAGTILVGSPTLNNGILPSLCTILQDMKRLRFKNKRAAAFGSYGWSGECVKALEEHFKACGFSIIREGIKCKWQPDDAAIAICKDFGREMGRATQA